jgi:prophage antirepressor-like protein
MRSSTTRLNFEGAELFQLTWKGNPCWIAIQVAEVAGSKSPKHIVSKYLQRNPWLKEGKNYETLLSRDLEELKELFVVENLGTTNLIHAKTRNLTIFYESALTHFISTRNLPKSHEMNKWLHEEVIPSIRSTGKYETTPSEEKRLREYAVTEKQKALVKQVNGQIWEAGGRKTALAIYHDKSAKGFTGKSVKGLKAQAKERGVPSRERTSGRQIIRNVSRPRSICAALQDELVSKGISVSEAHHQVKEASALIQTLDRVGVFDDAEAQQAALPKLDKAQDWGWIPLQALPNPFLRNRLEA